MRNFRDYEIWGIGMDISVATYTLTKSLPDNERFGLQNQMRRSAISIPSNIAEGCSRTSDKEFSRFLEISIGSSFELETQFLICQRIGYFSEVELKDIFEMLDKFQRKTNSLISKLT